MILAGFLRGSTGETDWTGARTHAAFHLTSSLHYNLSPLLHGPSRTPSAPSRYRIRLIAIFHPVAPRSFSFDAFTQLTFLFVLAFISGSECGTPIVFSR